MVDVPPPKDDTPINSQSRRSSQKVTLLVAEAFCGSTVGSLSGLPVTYSLPFISPSTLFFNVQQLSGLYQIFWGFT
jgi:hypothetical protein